MTKRELPPPFTFTDRAKAHIAKELAKHPEAKGLRVGLKTAGCSGNEYVFGLATEEKPGDLPFTVDGVKVFLELGTDVYMTGATLDLVTKGLNTALDFVDNPNESARCGCGESVTFKAQP